MKSHVALVVGIGIGILTALGPTPVRPVHLIATAAGQHEQHQGSAPSTETAAAKPGNMMMANMMAADAKLDALVKTMNEARGTARVDAVAAVVNALVEQHRTMRGMMGGHMSMMGGGMMNKPGGSAGATPAPPEK